MGGELSRERGLEDGRNSQEGNQIVDWTTVSGVLSRFPTEYTTFFVSFFAFSEGEVGFWDHVLATPARTCELIEDTQKVYVPFDIPSFFYFPPKTECPTVPDQDGELSSGCQPDHRP